MRRPGVRPHSAPPLTLNTSRTYSHGPSRHGVTALCAAQPRDISSGSRRCLQSSSAGRRDCLLRYQRVEDRLPSRNLIVLSRFNPKFRPISQSFSSVEIDTRMSPSICLHAGRRKTAVNTAVWDGKGLCRGRRR